MTPSHNTPEPALRQGLDQNGAEPCPHCEGRGTVTRSLHDQITAWDLRLIAFAKSRHAHDLHAAKALWAERIGCADPNTVRLEWIVERLGMLCDRFALLSVSGVVAGLLQNHPWTPGENLVERCYHQLINAIMTAENTRLPPQH